MLMITQTDSNLLIEFNNRVEESAEQHQSACLCRLTLLYTIRKIIYKVETHWQYRHRGLQKIHRAGAKSVPDKVDNHINRVSTSSTMVSQFYCKGINI